MNLLFICTRNYWRSLTAEKIFSGKPGINVRSAGTAFHARRRVNSKDILWAKYIFVMERKHFAIIMERFPHEILGKRMICLDIPDQYQYMDEELIEILLMEMKSHLKELL